MTPGTLKKKLDAIVATLRDMVEVMRLSTWLAKAHEDRLDELEKRVKGIEQREQP